MRVSLVRAGFVVSTVLLTTIAGVSWASEGGIVAKSGKQGGSCQQCHTGGKPPSIKLDGPLALEAGTIAAYTFRVESDAAVVVGMNAAISESDGIMYADDAGATREEDNEITHTRPNRFDAGVFTYSFFVKAPPYGGKLTVYAAGNACDGNGQNDGDESSRTTLTVDVSGPERPAPPEAGPPKPAPTGPTTTPTPDASTKRADDDAGTGNLAAPEEDSGCSIGWADRSSAPAGAMLAALVGLAAITRKKRRRA